MMEKRKEEQLQEWKEGESGCCYAVVTGKGLLLCGGGRRRGDEGKKDGGKVYRPRGRIQHMPPRTKDDCPESSCTAARDVGRSGLASRAGSKSVRRGIIHARIMLEGGGDGRLQADVGGAAGGYGREGS